MNTRLFAIVALLFLFSLSPVFAQMQTTEYWNNIGTEYFNQGDFLNAIECFLNSKNIIENTKGKENNDYLVTLYNLGFIHSNLGNYTQAIGYYGEVLSILDRANNRENNDYAIISNAIGELYFYTGDYAQSEKFLLEAANIREKIFGKNHVDYATSLNNLGFLYNALENYGKAEKYFLEALEIRERLLGKDHLDYAVSLNNAGLIYDNIGDYPKAERYYLESLKIIERIIGKDQSVYVITLNNIGGLYRNTGNDEKAEIYYLEALSIRERLLGKNHPDYAESLNNLGLVYLRKGDFEKTEKHFTEALAIMESAHGRENISYTSVLVNLGLLCVDMGNYRKAEEYYLDALGIMERIQGRNQRSFAALFNNLGSLYSNMGDYVKAEKSYLESLNIVEILYGKNHLSYATSLNNLGQLYRQMGNYSKAGQFHIEATKIIEQAAGKDHPNYTSSLNNLGLVYLSMGDYPKAEQCFLDTLSIRERAVGKEHPDYAFSLNGLGGLYEISGDYEKAEKFFLEAAALRERALGKDHPDYANSQLNLGNLYKRMGDFANAEKHYLESLNIRERALGKDHPDYAISLNNLGVLYVDLKDYEKAERLYLEAIKIIERLGRDHPHYALLLNNVGSFFTSIGDYANAERYYIESILLREQAPGKDHPDYALSVNNLGAMYQYMENYAQAEKYYFEALEIFERILGRDHPEYINSLNNLSSGYLSDNKFPQALETKKTENQIRIDQINRNFSFMSGQQREVFWNMNSGNFEFIYSISHFYPVSESNILSYNNALFSKGLLLRTTNAVRDAVYSQGNQALISQYEEMAWKRRQIAGLRQSGGNDAYIKELEQEADALEKSLVQGSSAFSKANEEIQADLAVNWQNVRGSLKRDEAAVEFVSYNLFDKKWSGKIHYAALVLRPGMASPQWIPLCEESTLTKIFEKAAGKRIDEQPQILYDDNGEELYKTIWQPLEKALEGAKTIYYSPSGLLHKIAFNAIPAERDTRLIDKYNLALVSSTREIVSSKRNLKPNTAVVYGGIIYSVNESGMREAARGFQTQASDGTRGESFQRTNQEMATRALKMAQAEKNTWVFLQGTVTESETIRNLLTQNRTQVNYFSGNTANEESFKALSGKKTAVIHLATHGFFIEDIETNYEERERLRRLGGGQAAFDNPLYRSGLIMAGANNAWDSKPVEGVEDGILFADEIAGLNLLGADLVVLSACETGLGTVNNSEGVFGLQRAFKLAGADTLIMSLWSVSDEATSLLMRDFYRAWLSGKSKQDAFKEAQNTLRGDSRFAPPFYWAAFVMID